MELILSDSVNGEVADNGRVSEFVLMMMSKIMSNFDESIEITLLYDAEDDNYLESMSEACDLIDDAVDMIDKIHSISNVQPHIKPMLKSLERLLRMYEGCTVIRTMADKARNQQRIDSSTYLIKNPSTNLLKIGKTTNMQSRLQSLQCGAGNKLEVIAIIDENIERDMHVKFSDLRNFNEWFIDPNGDIEAYFRKLSRTKGVSYE